MMNCTSVFAVSCLLCFGGCGQKATQTQADSTPSGRPETRSLQASELVGYNGKAMQKTLDKVLDKNDERNKDLQNALKREEP